MADRPDSDTAGQADGDLAEETLALLTTGCGFEEPVCPASVRNREADDLAAALAEAGAVMERLFKVRKERGRPDDGVVRRTDGGPGAGSVR